MPTPKRRNCNTSRNASKSHLTSIANGWTEGLDLPTYLKVEFDDTLLIWMDTNTRTQAAKDAIVSGMSPNEVRETYYGLGPVAGWRAAVSAATELAGLDAGGTARCRPRAAGSSAGRRERSRWSHDAGLLARHAPPLWTVEQAKVHLRITSTANDADIAQKLATAQEAILSYLECRRRSDLDRGDGARGRDACDPPADGLLLRRPRRWGAPGSLAEDLRPAGGLSRSDGGVMARGDYRHTVTAAESGAARAGWRWRLYAEMDRPRPADVARQHQAGDRARSRTGGGRAR